MGNISSLPANILNINTIFDISEKEEKFPVGPTTSNPGPILLSVANTAVKLVVKSKLSRDTISSEEANIII